MHSHPMVENYMALSMNVCIGGGNELGGDPFGKGILSWVEGGFL